MAQYTADVIVRGNVVKSERKAGDFIPEDDPTRKVAYDFIQARLLTPAYDTVDVRFPSDGTVKVPPADQLVEIVVEARASGGLRLTAKSWTPMTAPASAGAH